MRPYEEVLKNVKFPFEFHGYQKDDIDNACLAKSYGLYLDMGLGKTPVSTAVGIYKLIKGYNCVVTLVPASLITQWSDWLNGLGLVVTTYRGTPTERKKMDLDSDFIIMSPQIFQRDIEVVRGLEKPYFICDEATFMCNIQNLTYKLLMGGVKTEEYLHEVKGHQFGGVMRKRKVSIPRIENGMALLSGTPVNNPMDAYGLIKITNPDAYRSFGAFSREHVRTYDNFKRPTVFKNLNTLRENMLFNGVIRETTDHIDLPDKIYNVVRYDMSPKHKALYKRLVNEKLLILEDGNVIDATEAQVMYHTCQQFIMTPPDVYKGKIEALEVLDTLVKDTQRRIIFSNYRAGNDLLMDRYDAGGVYGNVSRKKQSDFVDAFKEGKLPTLVAHPKSGGVGLNLQICNQVMFAALPITAGDFKQSVARCWRQGQKETVVITVLVAKGTIQQTLLRRVMDRDDTVLKITHSKSSLRDDLLGEGI